MKTVYRFPLNIVNLNVIFLPTVARVLHVQELYEELQIWVELDTTAETMPREFSVFGTGHCLKVPRGRRLEHRGTAIMASGLVWHVYEVVDDG